MSFLDRIVRATVGRAQVPESAPSPAMISASWRVWAWNEAVRVGRPGRSTTEIQCDADSLLSWVFVPPASVDERPEGQDPKGLEAEPEDRPHD